MPMKCSICIHQSALEIDELLLAGTSLRNVAERFGTTTTTLHRHKQHISKVLVVAREAATVAKADTLLDQVKNLLAQAERLTEMAERSGSLDTALRGIAQVRGVLELLGEVSGQLGGKGANINIGINAGGATAVPNTLSNEALEDILRRNGRPLPPKVIEARLSHD